MYGNKNNILGRDLIKLHKEYNITLFEEFNIFVCTNEDLSNLIEYRNCTFHFIYLNPLKKWEWKYNATDTLILNFINLSNTYNADGILETILKLYYKKEEFNFIRRKLFVDFINFNLIINKDNKNNFGSELFIPLDLYINNRNNSKLKLDLFPFSNNYLSTGTKVITKIDDITIYTEKINKLKLLNIDLKLLKNTNVKFNS